MRHAAGTHSTASVCCRAGPGFHARHTRRCWSRYSVCTRPAPPGVASSTTSSGGGWPSRPPCAVRTCSAISASDPKALPQMSQSRSPRSASRSLVIGASYPEVGIPTLVRDQAGGEADVPDRPLLAAREMLRRTWRGPVSRPRVRSTPTGYVASHMTEQLTTVRRIRQVEDGCLDPPGRGRRGRVQR